MNIAVILTMYVTDARLRIYEQTIQHWFTNSPYNLFIVNSGGVCERLLELQTKLAPRLHVYQFQQTANTTSSVKHDGPSHAEQDALRRIFAHFKPELIKFDLVCKATCKYRLRDVTAVLSSLSPQTTLAVQSRHGWLNHDQNSEIYVCTPAILERLLAREFTGTFEADLRKFMDCVSGWQRLPDMLVIDRVPRNDGSVLTWL